MPFKMMYIKSEHTLDEVAEFLDDLELWLQIDPKRINIEDSERSPTVYRLPRDKERFLEDARALETNCIEFLIEIQPIDCHFNFYESFASDMFQKTKYYFGPTLGLYPKCKECRSYLSPETSCGKYLRRRTEYLDSEDSMFLKELEKEIKSL